MRPPVCLPAVARLNGVRSERPESELNIAVEGLMKGGLNGVRSERPESVLPMSRSRRRPVHASMVSGRNDRSQSAPSSGPGYGHRCLNGVRSERPESADLFLGCGSSSVWRPQWCPVGTTGVRCACTPARTARSRTCLNGVRSERPESDGSEDLNLRCHTLASMVSGRNDRSQDRMLRVQAQTVERPQWCPVGTTGVSSVSGRCSFGPLSGPQWCPVGTTGVSLFPEDDPIAQLAPQWCPVGTTGVRPASGTTAPAADLASMVSGRNDRSQAAAAQTASPAHPASMVSGRNDRSQDVGR